MTLDRTTWVRSALATIVACIAFAIGTGSALAAQGDIFFRSCTNSGGTAGCSAAPTMSNSYDIAVAPDGKTAYGGTFSADVLQIFDRDPVTGVLTARPGPANCFKVTPVSGNCTQATAMSRPLDVYITPDGKNLYAASWGSNGVAVFDRAADGSLTQKPGTAGCIGPVAGCTPGRAMANILSITPSPDGRNIYATAQTFGGSIAVLQRASDGTLSQASDIDGCVTETGTDGVNPTCTDGTAISIGYQLAVSPDGRHVYTAARDAGAIDIFNRDSGTGGLTQKNGTAGCIATNGYPDATPTNRCGVLAALSSPQAVTISPDGAHVYAGSRNQNADGGIVVFDRTASGLLTFASCLNEGGSNGCTNARNVSGIGNFASSPDGKALVAKDQQVGFSLFDVGSNGSLTQRTGTAGCFTTNGSGRDDAASNNQAGACTAVPTLGSSEGYASFFGNGFLYTAATGGNGAVNVFTRDFPPTCAAGNVEVQENTPTQVPLSCSDPNGDPLSLEIVSAPTAGNLGGIDQAASRVLYSPLSNFTGADSFSYRATANGLTAGTAAISLTVLAPPAAPPATGGGTNTGDGTNTGAGGGTPTPSGTGPAPAPPTGSSALPAMGSLVKALWLPSKSSTRVKLLAVTKIPAGGKVAVSCKGKGCPFKSKAVKPSRGGAVLTKLFKKARLAPKARLTIKITAPGRKAKTVVYTVQKGKKPKVKTSG